MSTAPTLKPKKNMTDDERAQVVTAVLALSSNGVPKMGAFVEVATKFPFTVITVRRVWHRADENAKANGTYTSTSRMKGRCGRHETDRSAALERLQAVPLTQRSTIRSAAAACGLPPPPSTAACKQGSSVRQSASSSLSSRTTTRSRDSATASAT
ncbi:uncharacterized protein KRP23_11537 [Phytophthora ramorum]|uniref:uncharacterized protein n=1 Tax=Phytophthora ramorum TaxID=164328 RepID=UPI0030976774|nr:hypothetical protein KRP23_11537 [Phytophthora ramorum]